MLQLIITIISCIDIQSMSLFEPRTVVEIPLQMKKGYYTYDKVDFRQCTFTQDGTSELLAVNLQHKQFDHRTNKTINDKINKRGLIGFSGKITLSWTWTTGDKEQHVFSYFKGYAGYGNISLGYFHIQNEGMREIANVKVTVDEGDELLESYTMTPVLVIYRDLDRK